LSEGIKKWVNEGARRGVLSRRSQLLSAAVGTIAVVLPQASFLSRISIIARNVEKTMSTHFHSIKKRLLETYCRKNGAY
jgi:hypothetical protein